LDDKLHEKLGMEVRNFMMPQPWCREMDPNAGGEIEFFADFECQVLPEGEIALVLERPELYEIALNDQDIAIKDIGEWHASAWRKVEIPAGLFVPGKNRFLFKTRLCYTHPGLESMFLVGDFGVKMNGNSFILTEPVRELTLGDWKDQGLPHYPGEVVYKTKVSIPEMEKAAIRLQEYHGTPAVIAVNGEFADRLLFIPDTTKLLDLPSEFELKLTHYEGSSKLSYSFTTNGNTTSGEKTDYAFTSVTQNLLIGAYQTTSGSTGRYLNGTISEFYIKNYVEE
jgi:hypothetical protein